LGGVTLLLGGCSGRDIWLDSAGVVDNSKPHGSADAGGDSKGGPNFGGAGFGGTTGGGASTVEPAATGGARELGPPPEHGGWLAYVIYDPSESVIQIATMDRECDRPLIVGQGTHPRQPAFSADGKQLAFAWDNTGQYQVYVMDLASGEVTRVTNEATGATYPSWSPNGRSIAFVTGDPESAIPNESRSSLMLLDTTTLQTRILATEAQPAYAGSAFASDNLLLVSRFSSLVGIYIDTLDRYDVSLPDTSGSKFYSPAISPDGSQFVFTGRCASARNQLYIGRVDGSTASSCEGATPLPSISPVQYSASWGPNGDIAVAAQSNTIMILPRDWAQDDWRRPFNDRVEVIANPAFAPASVALDCTK
jgi:hypothetical protein